MIRRGEGWVESGVSDHGGFLPLLPAPLEFFLPGFYLNRHPLNSLQCPTAKDLGKAGGSAAHLQGL